MTQGGGIKPFIPIIKEAIAICLLLTLLTVAVSHHSNHVAIISGLLLAAQFILMRWASAILNICLLLVSMLLPALVLSLTLGSDIGITTVVNTSLEEAGLCNPLTQYPILSYGMPILWVIALIGASAPLRATITGWICYVLWLIITPILLSNATMWQGHDSALMQQLSELFNNVLWMNAAVPGLFLLAFAIFFELLCNIFPGKKKDTLPFSPYYEYNARY